MRARAGRLGKFIDDLKGFEVATDAEGTIQSIRYNLKIKM